MFMTLEQARPIEIFYSYAHEDEKLRSRLERQLSLLKRQGQIIEWNDRKIIAGKEWASEINTYLNEADIILLLISPDFLASDYCYSIEMKRAMERHEAGDACVIPIILRPVDLKDTPFSKLQALPTNGKPVTRWSDRDEAFLDIGRGIQKTIKDITTNRNTRAKNLQEHAITYYILEDRLTNSAKIHFSNCIYCKDGKGSQSNPGGINSKWHGPFNTIQPVEEFAQRTGRKVSKCKICNPR